MNYPTKTLRERFSRVYYSTRNYRDYLQRKFVALAQEVTPGFSKKDRILDFGCGYGGLVNAIWELGFHNVRGTDISQWAIEEGLHRFPELKGRLQFYNRNLLCERQHLILMLDVLEHMPQYEIESVLKLARNGCVGHLVVRIPVSAVEGEPFVLPVSNNDPTHIACHPKGWWNDQLAKAGFGLETIVNLNSIYDSPGVLAAVYT